MFSRLCCLLLLCVVLLACRLSGEVNDNGGGTSDAAKDEANAQLCQKYDSCGCASYKACIETSRKTKSLDEPGVRECMLASSCQSLCDAKPDGCTGGSAAGGGTAAPKRSDCSSVSCSKDSDCPSDCYGGCDGVRCYSF
jgi:hypothetical protein